MLQNPREREIREFLRRGIMAGRIIWEICAKGAKIIWAYGHGLLSGLCEGQFAAHFGSYGNFPYKLKIFLQDFPIGELFIFYLFLCA